MVKRFNVTGACDPNRHYMVNLDSRLKAIREMVDSGEYFTINRARQYGKTTMLQALARYLNDEYEVVSLNMLSFNFNKNKKPGIQEIVLGDKVLIEAVV